MGSATVMRSRGLLRGAGIALDLLGLSTAFVAALLLCSDPPPALSVRLGLTGLCVIAVQYAALAAAGVPSLAWRYVGLGDFRRILGALGATVLILVLVRRALFALWGEAFPVLLPWNLLLIDLMLAFLCIAGLRVLARSGSERAERLRQVGRGAVGRKRTLLIGAGRAGVRVAQEVEQNPRLGIDIVGYVDDAPLKIGTRVRGIPVLGPAAALPVLVKRHRVEQAVISLASASGTAIRTLVRQCEAVRLPVRIIPGIDELLGDRVQVSRIREVMVEDLLRRPALEPDKAAIERFLSGKRVLITGAGGSIGSELCRQVASFLPAQLILLEQAENPLFYIHSELSHRWPSLAIVPVIADVADAERVEQVFALHRPHLVFHAAARKHVPMMEANPGEAVKTNILGTRCVAEAADRNGASAFVLISTDKAVNPTSVMGAAKRVAELLVHGLSRRSSTSFVTVRFGNVLGSAGSVLPTFRAQIERGGPVTVTHPDMERYFMTIPEACQLVMEAGAMGGSGQIFVLDMGQPIRVLDLARDLIRLSGFAEEEVPIQFSGLRPGEKLREELAGRGEDLRRTRHPRIFAVPSTAPLREEGAIERDLAELCAIVAHADTAQIRAVLKRIVPEMQDWESARALPMPPVAPAAENKGA